jgi:DNA-binding NarL/FixJ family response regulator
VKVLLVDDSAGLRARLAQMVREVCGPDCVREAGDAESALEIARSWIPDLVVLDIRMPGMSGLAILPHIKAACSSSVVIVLTNEASEHHRRQSISIGADFFFDKSKDFGRVVDVVGEMLTKLGETSHGRSGGAPMGGDRDRT